MFTAALLNNGQHTETTWMSSNRWTDEDVVYYTQWNISNKKKNLLWFQHDSMNGPRAYYAKWKKSERKIMYDFNLHVESRKQQMKKGKQ